MDGTRRREEKDKKEVAEEEEREKQEQEQEVRFAFPATPKLGRTCSIFIRDSYSRNTLKAGSWSTLVRYYSARERDKVEVSTSRRSVRAGIQKRS